MILGMRLYPVYTSRWWQGGLDKSKGPNPVILLEPFSGWHCDFEQANECTLRRGFPFLGKSDAEMSFVNTCRITERIQARHASVCSAYSRKRLADPAAVNNEAEAISIHPIFIDDSFAPTHLKCGTHIRQWVNNKMPAKIFAFG